MRVTLITLKFYILWYFCRQNCPVDDEKRLGRWMWMYVAYAAVQYLYNILWQRAPWVTTHPDSSGGVFGPERIFGGAHIVGYISIFALFLLAGWWVSVGRSARPKQRFWGLFCTLIIAYDLVFMTDTKHALILAPFAFLPFLFHPAFSVRLRMSVLGVGFLFILSTVFYFQIAVGQMGLFRQMNAFKDSPKIEMLYAVTEDFSHLVPYPLLGAGPGRFTSNQATEARTPLARRYILPYDDQQRRMAYWGRGGDVAQASILGIVRTDFFKLMGEFGWLGTIVFYAFHVWIVVRLFHKSLEWPLDHLVSGLFLGLSCCVIFFMFITLLIGVATIPVVAFPLWVFIGCIWDIKPKDRLAVASPA
jgi:hypothetical protein